MNIRCIAIDDEPPALKVLASYCARVPYLQLVGTISDPLDGIARIQQEKPDLVFLDIQMPSISGINIAAHTPNPPLFVFSTAHSKYAVEGFNLNALDYLLKPYDFERFMKAVAKAKREMELRETHLRASKADFIIVKVDYQNVKINTSDIIYVEALDNYVKIFTMTKCYVTLQSLKALLSILPAHQFVRVHKSFIVSIAHVNHFNKETITLDRKAIPIGKAFLQDFLASTKNK